MAQATSADQLLRRFLDTDLTLTLGEALSFREMGTSMKRLLKPTRELHAGVSLAHADPDEHSQHASVFQMNSPPIGL